MRAQHDALGKDVLAHLLEDEGTVEKEKVVAPKDSQRIDLVFTPDPAKRARRKKGPACLRLIRRMTQQTCMFELFSSPLTETLVLLSQRKQISVLDEQLVQRRRKGAKKSTARPTLPMQWILSPTRPKPAIETLGFHSDDSWPAGFYRGAAPGYKICIVALSELARTRESLPLRLLGAGRTRMEALGDIAAMSPDDPDRPVLLALLGWIRYVIRENRNAAKRLSKEPEFMAVTREGFEDWMKAQQKRAAAQVVREARIEGKAEGKAASLLAVLDAREIAVSARLRAQILSCTDDRVLDMWIRRAATADSVREVLAQTN